MDEIEKKQYQTSLIMVKNLQNLFKRLGQSTLQYEDPSSVLNNIVDDFGQNVEIHV